MIFRNFLSRRNLISATGLLALVLLWSGLSAITESRQAGEGIGLTTEVHRGPLTISLVESGTIRNRERVVVRSEVEGSRTIIQLVDEGTMVEAGDLLVELDSSSLEEQRLEQGARVENGEAAVIQSSESLEVVRNQAAADVARAELDLRFAKLALEQYQEGEYPQQLQQAEAAIAIAGEELRRTEDELEWSRRLENEGYITRSEMEADELALKRRQLDLELAQGKLELLTRYTMRQEMEKLQSDIQQAEMALERVRRRARADVIRAEADLRSRESDLRHQKNRLSRLEDQIGKCRIVAPAGGMVIYATSMQTHRWRRIDPLEPGQTVRERQELIHLPTTGDMMVEISVQEASLPKISPGLPALITLDSGTEQEYRGRLHRIGILPDSSSMALNPDLKLYNCEVHIDPPAKGLRQGMSCTVELLIEQHDDALQIPLQSLVRVDAKPTVYVVASHRAKPRTVRVGLDNGRLVHVLEGLEPGERILLTPPLADSSRRQRPVAADDGPATDHPRQQHEPDPPGDPVPEGMRQPNGGAGPAGGERQRSTGTRSGPRSAGENRQRGQSREAPSP